MDTRTMARLLGQRGGRARARRLTPARRREIAALGAQGRRQSLEAARRVAANQRYAAIVTELRGGDRALTRMKTFAGPLPGLYPRQR